MLDLHSYAAGRWIAPDDSARQMRSAVTGVVVARGGARLDMQAMIDHAMQVGGPALRAMDFHQRAKTLKALPTIALVVTSSRSFSRSIS